MISAADDVGLNVSKKKTVTMIFNPSDSYKRFNATFRQFSMRRSCMSCVACFKCLGHMTDRSMHDNSDIDRALKGLFARANLLTDDFGDVHAMSNCDFLEHFVCVFMT